MSQLSPLPLEAPTPKQATEVNRDEAAHALSRACSGLLRQTGKWLANDVSTDHNIDPEVRKILRDFGLNALTGAARLDPMSTVGPPDFGGEGYSPMPEVRRKLKKAGVDPDKPGTVTIGVLDEHGDERSHGSRVVGVIKDKQDGLSPNAQVTRFQYTVGEKVGGFADAKPAEVSLSDAISVESSGALERMTAHFQRIGIDERDPNMRVLNISLGVNSVHLAESLVSHMLKEPDKYRPWLNKLVGEETAEKWIKAAGLSTQTPETNELDKKVYDALIEQIHTQLKTDTKFHAALSDYQRVTKQMAESGITIVVSASNSGDPLPELHLYVPADSGYNFYAQSDHVMSIGAANMNKTPKENSDDYVTAFSSAGNERFHPKVVAPGVQLASGKDGIAGTSFSSPAVSATIGLMLDQNPSLTFNQIGQLLTENASRLDLSGPERQGAGELNIDEAVLAARDSRNRKWR